MNFASDNWAGITDAVMGALIRANGDFAPAYGNDTVSARVTARFSELFETDVEVHFVATGTAANALSLAAATVPGGLIFCTTEAHVTTDEFGATEFYTNGMKLISVATRAGLMQLEALEATLRRYPKGGRFGHPTLLTVTQATECGTVYPLDHLRALTRQARAAGLTVHMDGARFGNAVAALDATPAELTWKSGVDIMSFGASKNGCLGAEAIIVFGPGRFPHLATLRQRAGHVVSKARFVAAQFEAYLDADNWLKTARHANAMAARLRHGIASSGTARLGWDSEANEVFPIVAKPTIARLKAAGAQFYDWDATSLPENTRLGDDEDLIRLVASFATRPDEVDHFIEVLNT
ncbi:MAG: L-threonine aldolase [Devosia sp.]|nr:L-threonine aldolase [Devosia sp.]